MKPIDWDEKKEIKIPAKLYEMLEERARKDGRDTDTLIKYILLDALAPSIEKDGQRIGAQAEKLGKKSLKHFQKERMNQLTSRPILLINSLKSKNLPSGNINNFTQSSSVTV